MRIYNVVPQVVELAPPLLQAGRLYISFKHRAVVHLCCCGCGEKVVTPLSTAEWQLQLRDGRATLHPSIGNWSMACQSHYWIRNNQVIWSKNASKAQIRAVFRRDERDLREMHSQTHATRLASANSPRPTTQIFSEHPHNNMALVQVLKRLWR